MASDTMDLFKATRPIRNRSTRRLLRTSKLIKRAIPLALSCFFLPWLTLFFVICGVIDFARNSDRSWEAINRYFFGNGILTWLLSPLNLLLDLLSLPYRNPGVYSLEDLPDPYQQEIRQIICVADSTKFLNLMD